MNSTPDSKYISQLKAFRAQSEVHTSGTLRVATTNRVAKLSEGAGLRIATFLQGCPRFCPGCNNVREIKFRPGKPQSPEQFVDEVSALRTVALPSESDAETAFAKMNWLGAVASMVWEMQTSTHNHESIADMRASDFFSATDRFMKVLRDTTVAYPTANAPEAWPLRQTQGVTFSGGEPMAQAEAVIATSAAVRSRFPDWDIWLYAGTEWESIVATPELRRVAEAVDVVKCGSFKWRKRWRAHPFFGSENQYPVATKPSIAQGSPQLAELPAIVNQVMLATAKARDPLLTPVWRPSVIKDIANWLAKEGPREARPTVETIEKILGPADSGIVERCFLLAPVPSKTKKLKFTHAKALNVHSVTTGPLIIGASGRGVEVRIQGGAFAPPANVKPSLTSLRPARVVEPEQLVEEIVEAAGKWKWSSPTNEAEVEKAWLNLALFYRQLTHHRDYELIASPVPGMALELYHEKLERLTNRLKQMWTNQISADGVSIPVREIIITGGDPSIQPEAVAAILKHASERGIRSTVQLPRRSTTEPCKNLESLSDCLVTGLPHDGGPPWPGPLLGSPKQRLHLSDPSVSGPALELETWLSEHAPGALGDVWLREEAWGSATNYEALVKSIGCDGSVLDWRQWFETIEYTLRSQGAQPG